MKKLLKRFCALILSAVIVLSVCSSGGTSVLAENYEEGQAYLDVQDSKTSEEGKDVESKESTSQSNKETESTTQKKDEGGITSEQKSESSTEKSSEEITTSEQKTESSTEGSTEVTTQVEVVTESTTLQEVTTQAETETETSTQEDKGKKKKEKSTRIKGLCVDVDKLYPSTWTELEREANYAYWVGEGMKEKFVKARKTQAKKLDLEEYLDDDYYMNSEFFLDGKNDPVEVVNNGGYILIRRLSYLEQEQGMYWDRKTATYKKGLVAGTLPEGIIPRVFASSDSGKVNYIGTGIFAGKRHGLFDAVLGGSTHPAFCLDNSMTSVITGKKVNVTCEKGDSGVSGNWAAALKNKNRTGLSDTMWHDLKKAVYYGVGGPGQGKTNGIDNFCKSNPGGNKRALCSEATSYFMTGYSYGGSDGGIIEKWIKHLDSINYNNIANISNSDGFLLYKVAVDGKQPLVFGNYNSPKQGGVFFSKKSSGLVYDEAGVGRYVDTSNTEYYSLEGAQYAIWEQKYGRNKDEGGYEIVETDANGCCVAKFDAGDYYVQEIVAPKGFKLDNTIFTVKIVAGDDDATIDGMEDGNNVPNTHVETPKSAKIELSKSSSDPNCTRSIAGAVYSVKGVSNSVDTTMTTGANGYAYIDKIPLGKYEVKEIIPPVGFELDPNTYTVTLADDWFNDEIKVRIDSVDNPIPPRGKISLHKSFSSDCVVNNPNYSLDGAEYTVYSDISNNVPYNQVGVITTDSTGYGELGGLNIDVAGTNYYVKETKASKGCGLDPKVYTAKLTRNYTVDEVKVDVYSKEPVHLDPVTVALRKVDSETGGAPIGDNSMENAHYSVEFYPDIMDTDPALSGKTPMWSWLLKTTADENGATLLLNDASKITGDEFVKDEYGSVVFPYGTVTIKEVKAPDGYYVNPETIVVPITDDPAIGVGPQYHVPIQKEVAVSLKITKKCHETGAVLKGAVFRHTKPDGSTEDLSTDSNGRILFPSLEAGEHKIEEIKAPDGYALNPHPIMFNLSEISGELTMLGSLETYEDDGNGNFKSMGYDDEGDVAVELTHTAEGDFSAVLYDRLAPYKLHIHKENDDSLSLGGAEFTLYRDKECTDVIAKKVTDNSGDLTFDNLKPELAYYLKETKAPAGYRLPQDSNGNDIVWKVKAISVPEGEVFDFRIDDKSYVSYDSDKYYVSGDFVNGKIANMGITNERQQKLPETGSNAMLILFGLGVSLLGVSLYLKRRKSNK